MFARKFRQAQAARAARRVECADVPVSRQLKGKIILGKYMGELLADGKPHGLGMAMYADECVYIGDWHSGKRTGFGILESGCNIFEGQYAEDVRTGHGIKTSRKQKRGNLKILQGRWSRGVLNGKTAADKMMALDAASKAREQADKIKKMLGVVGDDNDAQCKTREKQSKDKKETEGRLLQIVGGPCRPTKPRTHRNLERQNAARRVNPRCLRVLATGNTNAENCCWPTKPLQQVIQHRTSVRRNPNTIDTKAVQLPLNLDHASKM
jgi:hypothetical protein